MNLDKHLERVQEDKTVQEVVTEIEPMLTGAAIASALILANFVTVLFSALALSSSIKADNKLTKRLNKILGSGNKYKVHIYNTKEPNAFAMAFGNHIFVTTGLMKLLNEKEIDAIMLHEAYHNKSMHIYKGLAYKYTFYYIAVGVVIAAGPLVTLAPVAVALVIFLMMKVSEIAYNVTVAKRQEYNADSYAAKKGYGKYLISAFVKLEKHIKKLMQKETCGTMCKLVNKIDDALDEHPSDKKRIENILKKSKELKSATYGKVKNFVMKAWK